MFLMYPHRKKSSGERSGLRGGQGIGPPLPIEASGNLSFKTSSGERSGLQGGQGIGPTLPIQASGNLSFKKIKWREIWASRWPGYWSTLSN